MAWQFWVGFHVFVFTMLALDLGVFHKKDHVIRVREALLWTFVWVSLAMFFSGGVMAYMGKEKALEFLAGYLMEESLSVDNLFVILLIFSYFKVPTQLQHRVLFWGILGALVMRLGFILAGTALINRFHWLVYVFGAILVFSGIKIGMEQSKEFDPSKNPFVALFRRWIPITKDFHGRHFFVKQFDVWHATPLFVCLMVVETSDVIFAVDSIPAVLAISKDPFIVYTSNVFAIMGLRSLFFALAGMMDLFHFLKYGLAFILCFVGVKMLISSYYYVSIEISLLVIAMTLVASIVASLVFPQKHTEPPVHRKQ